MDELLTLAEAAEKLGIAPVTLRAGIARGTLRARKFGQTWVTTEEEVDRYARHSLGQVGRPPLQRKVYMTGRVEIAPEVGRMISDEDYLAMNGIPKPRTRRAPTEREG